MRVRDLLACVLVASATVAGWSEEGAPAPRITVAPERFDFGAVLPGKEVSREFLVRNLGTADLSIDKVQPSCGCTLVDKYSSLLKPGETTALRVKLTTPPSSGRILKTVLVRSNDPARPVVELKLEATVTPAGAGPAR